jgi:hypothetical protein
MRQRIASLFCFALIAVSVSLAQTNCPEGLKYAGLLSGSGSYGAPFDQKVFISLPRGAKPDTTYQQKSTCTPRTAVPASLLIYGRRISPKASMFIPTGRVIPPMSRDGP